MGVEQRAWVFRDHPVFILSDLVTWECLGARWWGRRCGRSSLLWQGCSASGFPRGGVSLSPCYPCPQPSSSSSRPEHFHMSSQPSGTGHPRNLHRELNTAQEDLQYTKLDPMELNNTRKAKKDILFFNRVPKD